MNRANQAALFQETNQGLLQIRQLELNYYIDLNIAFGTQAALIGGFTYGLFTQNQFNEDIPYAEVFQEIYWVTSAGTIAASVHVIITTMLLQVLGPGLALHGPIGSMAKAAQGMRVEQRPIIVAFVLMMFLFSLSTVLSFFAVMSFKSSIGATICFIVAARYWWYYCERIYLRFYWEVSEDVNRYGEYHPHDEYDEIDPAEPQLPEHLRSHTQTGTHTGTRTRSKEVLRSRPSKHSFSEKRRRSIFSRMFSFGNHSRHSSGNNHEHEESKKSRLLSKASKYGEPEHSDLVTQLLHDSHAHAHNAEDEEQHEHAIPPIVTSSEHITMEGYLLKKGHPHKGFIVEYGKEWERRYFVLHINAHLYFYASRQSFREKPRKPMYKRPLNLVDFIVEVSNPEDELRRETLTEWSASEAHSRMSEAELFHAFHGPKSSSRRPSLTPHTQAITQANTVANAHAQGAPSPHKHEQHKMFFLITLVPKENESGIALDSSVSISTSMRDPSSGRESVAASGENPMREPWVLRCDTEEELEMWIAAMRQVSPDSFLE